jgi:hypothetical protein
MATMEMPETPFHDLVLEPERRTTRGGNPVSDHRLEGWMSLGEPVSIPITSESVGDDEELRQVVEAEAEKFKYHLVYLACTFRPYDDEPFLRAYLQVQLAHTNGKREPRPIAWSMRPLRLEDAVELSRTVKLEAKLPLVPQVFSAGTGAEITEKSTVRDVFLEAMNEREPNPTWEFYRTDRAEIRGVQRLYLVTRSPKDIVAQGTVALSATIQRRLLGIVPYHATFPDAPYRSFQLP